MWGTLRAKGTCRSKGPHLHTAAKGRNVECSMLAALLADLSH